MASAKTTRRAVLGAGVVIVAAAAGARIAGVDDDALRAVGIEPHPEPDPVDDSLLARAVSRQQSLVADLDAVADANPSLSRRIRTERAAVRDQLRTLGGTSGASAATSRPGSVDELARRFSSAADASTAAALRAVSPDLARVLASLGAGQTQIARSLGRLA